MPSVTDLDGAVLGCIGPGILNSSPSNRDKNDEPDSNTFRAPSMESVLMAWLFPCTECQGVVTCFIGSKA